jgi:polyhydroxybutyrate depolymerase
MSNAPAFRLVLVSTLFVLLAHFALAPAPVNAQESSCSPARPATEIGVSENTLLSGGLERFYITYVPSGYNPSEPVPLVITIHGFADSAARQREYSGWDEIAERETFISVHPQGTRFPRRWHAYQDDVSFMERGTIDDVQFFRDLLDQLNEGYCIDPARVYVNGLSNGGGMTYRLACDLSDQFAAAGIVAGAIPAVDTCDPTRSLPLIAFHGTDDPIVPYEGTNQLAGAEAWVANWAERGGCDPTPAESATEEDIVVWQYSGCDDDAEVILYTVEGGGHSWPGSSPLPAFLVDSTTQSIDATELIWDFFAAHPLR